jgi:hypothetical protein
MPITTSRIPAKKKTQNNIVQARKKSESKQQQVLRAHEIVTPENMPDWQRTYGNAAVGEMLNRSLRSGTGSRSAGGAIVGQFGAQHSTESVAGVVQREDDFRKLSGSANEVFEVTHETDHSKGYWKPDAETENSVDPASPLKTRSNMGARSVLSSDVDRLLGTNVLARETYRTHEGRGGSESSAVQGTTVSDNNFDTPVSKDVYDAMAPTAPASFKQGRNPGEYFQASGTTFNRHDFAHPKTQKDLANLQLNDALMGQNDRHGGNIKIDDATHEARGFDNDSLDLTFRNSKSNPTLRDNPNLHTKKFLGMKKPKWMRSKAEKAAKAQAREEARAKLGNRFGKMVGLPSHIDAAAAERIRGMKSKAFMAQLTAGNPENAGRMDPEHMQELKERYSALRRYVKEGSLPASQKRPDSPTIVQPGGWNQTTYLDTLAKGRDASYVGRSVGDYNEVQQSGGRLNTPAGLMQATQTNLGPLPTSANPAWFNPGAHTGANRRGMFMRQPAPAAPMPPAALPPAAPATAPALPPPTTFAPMNGRALGTGIQARLRALQGDAQ